MNLYFYTHVNLMFDFLSRNLIAPDAIIKDLKGNHTISTSSDLFLFVTHKKLDRKSREKGIAEPEFTYPITLELSETSELDKKAILVSKNESGYVYELEAVSAYNSKKHIGMYLIGEIPLSRVHKIYFDSQENMEGFFRPSPDYWYPKEKYALLPDDFTDELEISPETDKLIAVSEISKESIIVGFTRNEKRRAAVLNFINGTKRWQIDKYIFNIDDYLKEFFGLSNDEITMSLPHYNEMKEKGKRENITFFFEERDENPNQLIFNYIAKSLIKQSCNNQRLPEQMVQLLQDISKDVSDMFNKLQEKKIIENVIGEIEWLISDKADKTPEEISQNIPEEIDVLKALMFVVKNPSKYALFMESLKAYQVDFITQRRAMVLWGYLNGLHGMPGENSNKDNALLWHFIEWKEQDSENVSLNIEKPSRIFEKNKVLGIELTEERIITAAEVREKILASSREKCTDSFYKKLLSVAEEECGSKKKAENKGYSQSVASIDMNEIRAGDVLDSNMRKQLETLIKDCKKLIPNKEKLYKDYVEDASKFEVVFNKDPNYWKKWFQVSLEKKDEKL